MGYARNIKADKGEVVMLNFLWKILLFFTLLDCFIIVIGGGIWILNIWFREMTGKDLAKEFFEKYVR